MGLSERYRRRGVRCWACWPGSGWNWPRRQPPAGRDTRHRRAPGHGAAADRRGGGAGGHGRAGGARGRRLRAAQGPRRSGTVLIDMDTGGRVDLLPDREAASFEGVAGGPSRRAGHLPGPGRQLRRGRPRRAPRARSRSPTAGTCGTTWPNTPRRRWLPTRDPEGPARRRRRRQHQHAGHRGHAGARTTKQGERAMMPDGCLDACGRERRLVRPTRERYAEIHRRLDAGESLSGISRATGLDRKTVQRFARAGGVGELLGKATSRESKLDDFTPSAPAVERRRHRRRRAPRRAAGNRAGPAASRPSAATSGHSGRRSPPRTRPRQCRRPARSPAGC